MFRERVDAPNDLRVVDEESRQLRFLCRCILQCGIVKPYIRFDEGIRGGRIEHPRGRAVTQETVHHIEIEEELHLQPVANLGQLKGHRTRLVVEHDVIRPVL